MERRIEVYLEVLDNYTGDLPDLIRALMAAKSRCKGPALYDLEVDTGIFDDEKRVRFSVYYTRPPTEEEEKARAESIRAVRARMAEVEKKELRRLLEKHGAPE